MSRRSHFFSSYLLPHRKHTAASAVVNISDVETSMCVDFDVKYVLFLFDFYQIRNVLTGFSKNPKYEISRKVLLVGVAVCRSDI